MKTSLFLLLLFICTSAYSEMNVGRYLEYSVKNRDDGQITKITEKVVAVDTDFDSHLRTTLYSPSDTLDKWVYNSDTSDRLVVIKELFENCEAYKGTYEVLKVKAIPFVTCKFTSLSRYLDTNIVGIENYDRHNSTIWIGPGPYNGLFKVIDREVHKLFKLTSFK